VTIKKNRFYKNTILCEVLSRSPRKSEYMVIMSKASYDYIWAKNKVIKKGE